MECCLLPAQQLGADVSGERWQVVGDRADQDPVVVVHALLRDVIPENRAII